MEYSHCESKPYRYSGMSNLQRSTMKSPGLLIGPTMMISRKIAREDCTESAVRTP